jgi:hypothetical protein
MACWFRLFIRGDCEKFNNTHIFLSIIIAESISWALNDMYFAHAIGAPAYYL